MLQVEVDIFSGRPNPVWLITDLEESREVLGRASEARGAMARPGTGYGGLGYREVRVTQLGDDASRPARFPREFALGSTAAEDLQASGELARSLVERMLEDRESQLVAHTLTPLTSELREFILEQLFRFLTDPPLPGFPPESPPNPLRTTVNDSDCDRCQYEISRFNPAFWNRPAVQPHNNCYNYARNWRTDTFAQPGRAHGAQTDTMACPDVTHAAMADGLHQRCSCLPESEYPRRLMALVVAPGWDYHWYREQQGGFFGHKPGPTAARNTDNNNALVVNPETCARDPYTDFCGYFYAGRSVVIN